MPHNGSTWSPYQGTNALLLAGALLVIAGVLAYLGTRLDHSVRVERPGKTIAISLVLLWILAVATYVIAVVTYVKALYAQVGNFTSPANPITPITALSGLVTFIVITVSARHHGLKVAVGSAIVGTLAAPMIFELPFDLIVITRTYPPTPAIEFTLLFFLPLFLVEVLSFTLLTLSPLMKLSRYTLFSLSGMFLVFAVWAMFGFSYPSSAIPIAFNGLSKVLSFVAAITLFMSRDVPSMTPAPT